MTRLGRHDEGAAAIEELGPRQVACQGKNDADGVVYIGRHRLYGFESSLMVHQHDLAGRLRRVKMG